jgi:hypothetical protein
MEYLRWLVLSLIGIAMLINLIELSRSDAELMARDRHTGKRPERVVALAVQAVIIWWAWNV